MKKTSTGENPNTIIFILLFLFLFGGWLFWPSGNSDTSEPAKVEQKVNWQPVLNAVDISKENGFLKKVDNLDRSVYVDHTYWTLMNANTKENSVRTFARYLGYLNDMDQAIGITVKDWQSGKTIAEYSVFSGVSIK